METFHLQDHMAEVISDFQAGETYLESLVQNDYWKSNGVSSNLITFFENSKYENRCYMPDGLIETLISFYNRQHRLATHKKNTFHVFCSSTIELRVISRLLGYSAHCEIHAIDMKSIKNESPLEFFMTQLIQRSTQHPNKPQAIILENADVIYNDAHLQQFITMFQKNLPVLFIITSHSKESAIRPLLSQSATIIQLQRPNRATRDAVINFCLSCLNIPVQNNEGNSVSNYLRGKLAEMTEYLSGDNIATLIQEGIKQSLTNIQPRFIYQSRFYTRVGLYTPSRLENSIYSNFKDMMTQPQIMQEHAQEKARYTRAKQLFEEEQKIRRSTFESSLHDIGYAQ